jgi:hypothetical protein
MQKICISLFLCIFLLGCSSQPLKIDIPATTFSSSKLSSSKPKLQSIEIINKAKEGKLKNSPLGSGFTLTSRTHQKRPIMAVEVCHAEAKKILPGVQTGGC